MKKIILGVLFSTSLVGCVGGGGGGGESPPLTPAAVVVDPNLSVPLQAAIANLVNNGFNKPFTVSGWIDNSTSTNPLPRTPISGSGTYTIGMPTAATANGTAVLKVTQVMTGATTANGQTQPLSSTAQLYFNPGNYTLFATVIGSDTELIAPYAYPASVKAGSAGALASGTTGKILPTTSTQTYTVASDSANSLLVTIIRDSYGAFTGHDGQTQTVYRVDTSGKIDIVSMSAQKLNLNQLYQVLNFTF